VRELKNIVERCLIFCDRGEIDVADLPVEVRSVGGEPKADAGAEAEGGLGTLDDAEKTHIQRALMATGWNKSRAAKILAIDRNTLHAKIKRHGLGQ
jgi:transcriptional regulator of acetoin/glycerol metabolism